MMTTWIVELFKDGDYKRRRTFASREAAITFANNFRDDCKEGWDVQLIAPNGTIGQIGVNGNDK